jgi:predicted RNA-binding protein with EMAP domain
MNSDIFDEINSGKYNLVEREELNGIVEENKKLRESNIKLKKIIKFLNKELSLQDEILNNMGNVKYFSCLDCDKLFKKFFD